MRNEATNRHGLCSALPLRTLVASGKFLFAIGLAPSQLWACQLPGLGELIALAFAGAIPVGNLAGTLSFVCVGAARVQKSDGDKKIGCLFHALPPRKWN
jgi:hypothetical protein